MNTFTVALDSKIADEAFLEVKELPPETWVAVRGEVVDGVVYLYSVSTLDEQDHPSRYMWVYMLAKDWLAEYKARKVR